MVIAGCGRYPANAEHAAAEPQRDAATGRQPHHAMTTSTAARARIRGFTLIELLVALFISALMFAMGYGAINQALQNRGSIRQHQEKLVALETTMQIMEQDFVQLAPRPVRQPVGDGYLPCLQGGPASQTSDT